MQSENKLQERILQAVHAEQRLAATHWQAIQHALLTATACFAFLALALGINEIVHHHTLDMLTTLVANATILPFEDILSSLFELLPLQHIALALTSISIGLFLLFWKQEHPLPRISHSYLNHHSYGK